MVYNIPIKRLNRNTILYIFITVYYAAGMNTQRHIDNITKYN